MARRLEPEVRKAEIISSTRAMIAEGKGSNLSLRAVARHCGMTAPGLSHHFADLTELLEAVIRQREDENFSLIETQLLESYSDPTLRDLADTLVRFYADRPEEARNYDRFEAEALSPGHPAHAYFQRSSVRPLPLTVALIEKEYANPTAVIQMLSLVVDGLRMRWLHDDEADYWSDWVAVRDTVFTTFERL
ncbi:MAG TPA: helix-turn-helix domain-containing protein [Solirubrobacterales bacterium]